MPLVLAMSAPEYQVDIEPDHAAVGKKIDDVLRQHFMNQTIVARGVSMSAHQDISIDDLVMTIQQLGTDRYDPSRIGDRYENVAGKHIDFFGFRRKVTPRMRLFKDISWGFYHGSKIIHGNPVRIDLLLVYDGAQLKAVAHQYEGRTNSKRDGFVFKNPTNKPASLLAIVKIL
jgi:hypothetical protein